MNLKFTSITLFFLFSFNLAHSQSFRAGMLLGIVASQVEGDNMGGFNKAGLSAGFFTNRSINEKWSVQMEMKYIQKGSKSRNRINPLDSNAANNVTATLFYKMKLDYIEVPVLFRYRNKKFVYEFGPSLNTIIVSKIYDNYGEIPAGSYDSPQYNPFNRFEIEGIIGIGYPLNENILMNWRFSTSLTPIRPFQRNQTYRLNRGQYNTLMEISLKYQFKRKERTEDAE